jgi:hypothetical protein
MQTPRYSTKPNRRTFLKTVTTLGMAVSAVEMPRLARARDITGEINVGLIGLGVRGYEVHEELRRCHRVRVGGISEDTDT